MTGAFDKIMAGLDDASAYLDGDRSGFVVHDIEVSDPDVAAIRRRTGLSQSVFARSIGVPLGTLKDWEQGCRRPGTGARVARTDRQAALDRPERAGALKWRPRPDDGQEFLNDHPRPPPQLREHRRWRCPVGAAHPVGHSQGAASGHRCGFRAPARCRPEVGGPSRPRVSRRSVVAVGPLVSRRRLPSARALPGSDLLTGAWKPLRSGPSASRTRSPGT